MQNERPEPLSRAERRQAIPQNRTLKEIALELLDKYSTSESIAIGEYSFDLIADHKELDEEIARYLAEIEAAEKIEIDSLTQRNKAAMDCTRKPTSQRPNQ